MTAHTVRTRVLLPVGVFHIHNPAVLIRADLPLGCQLPLLCLGSTLRLLNLPHLIQLVVCDLRVFITLECEECRVDVCGGGAQ